MFAYGCPNLARTLPVKRGSTQISVKRFDVSNDSSSDQMRVITTSNVVTYSSMSKFGGRSCIVAVEDEFGLGLGLVWATADGMGHRVRTIDNSEQQHVDSHCCVTLS